MVGRGWRRILYTLKRITPQVRRCNTRKIMPFIRKFILEDVRCFEGRQELNIRPITFLVGENSTGKSTVLGCYQALLDYLERAESDDYRGRRKNANIDFNVDPYQMGMFSDIARKRTRSECFKLGVSIILSDNEIGRPTEVEYLTSMKERDKGAEAVVDVISIDMGDSKIEFNLTTDDKEGEFFTIKSDNQQKMNNPEKAKKIFSIHMHFDNFHGMVTVESVLGDLKWRKDTDKDLSEIEQEFFNCYIDRSRYSDTKRTTFLDYSMLFLLHGEGGKSNRTISFSPVRSKPLRTYNPSQETEDPEGAYIPTKLRNLAQRDKDNWKLLQNKLNDFGQQTGLFKAIRIKKHGQKMSDPFQISVRTNSSWARNITDVGYGVSQILPILVRVLNEPGNASFLLQQPEVHLHPKGQAGLATLLCELVANHRTSHSFIIETHSDHMIDRVRIEIMKKNIPPDDVSLIYFEPQGNFAAVHNITFDEQGNMIDAPPGYREFFMNEGDRLLGLGGD